MNSNLLIPASETLQRDLPPALVGYRNRIALQELNLK